MKNPTILLCDDEDHLREMVAEYLASRDFDIVEARNAAELRKGLKTANPDLIVLDVRMPEEDGLTALRALRAQHRVPVIMLTGASGTIDRVVGLELGADDYLGKPVDLRELEARIKAILRRKRPSATDPARTEEPVEIAEKRINFGPCSLDAGAARLFGPDGVEIPITAMEYTLLGLFARNAGRILNRDQILDETNDPASEPFDRTVDLRISRLRRKIERNPARPEIIKTIRGLGYIYYG